MLYTHKVIHVETGACIRRFTSEQEAQEWIDRLYYNPDDLGFGICAERSYSFWWESFAAFATEYWKRLRDKDGEV